MAVFVNECEKEDCSVVHLVIDVIRKWLWSPTRETVRPDVIASAPLDNFTQLTGNTFAKITRQSFGDLGVLFLRLQ